MSRAARWGLFVVTAASLASIGCADEVHTGTIAKVPLLVGPLGGRPGAPLLVAPPRDARPAIEHLGEEDHTRFFFTVAVVTHWERAGNYVTTDDAASPIAPGELRQTVADALTSSRAATVVPDTGAPQFVLETDIEHLYATHYAISQGTVVVVASSRRGLLGGGAGVTARQYASYGNVVLKARLVDRRTGSPVVVWDEHVTGTGQAMPSKEHVESAQTALRMAVSDAIAMLSIRVGVALDRLGQGPNGAGYVLTQMPAVFLIERVSRFRDFLETVYVETRSGRVLRHDIAPMVDHAHGRPGEWLVSRRTPEGIMLSGDGYEALARALADKYDVRAYDDVERYHFFGVKGVVAAPAGKTELGNRQRATGNRQQATGNRQQATGNWGFRGPGRRSLGQCAIANVGCRRRVVPGACVRNEVYYVRMRSITTRALRSSSARTVTAGSPRSPRARCAHPSTAPRAPRAAAP